MRRTTACASIPAWNTWRSSNPLGNAVKGAPGEVSEELIKRLIAPYLAEAQAAVAEGIVADAGAAAAWQAQ